MHGYIGDSGFIYEHLKPFPEANITAIISGYEAIPIGWFEDESDRIIAQCFFLLGIHTDKTLGQSLRWRNFRKPIEKMVLNQVNPIIISEVLSDLTAVAANGK